MRKRELSETVERRAFPVRVECREMEDDGKKKKKLVGYAAVFNKLSEMMWGFRERIAPGAFKKTLRENDILAFWNHNSDIVLGRTRSETLSLREDSTGLSVEIDPPETDTIRDLVVEPVRRGDVDQMSFGFNVLRDKWEEVDGELIRTLLEVRLYEVSPVAMPAYPQTSVSVRAIEKAKAFRESDDDLRSTENGQVIEPAPGPSAHPPKPDAPTTPERPPLHLAGWRMDLEIASAELANHT